VGRWQWDRPVALQRALGRSPSNALLTSLIPSWPAPDAAHVEALTAVGGGAWYEAGRGVAVVTGGARGMGTGGPSVLAMASEGQGAVVAREDAAGSCDFKAGYACADGDDSAADGSGRRREV